jgi:hypothetical protein
MDIRSCRTLIDGYNALFALSWMPPGKASSGGASILQAARNRLVVWIDTKAPDPASVVVVFDGRGNREQGPIVSKREGSRRGVRVVFSPGEADDLLEDLISGHPNPGRLTVVSDDRRIREAANRRRCIPLDVAEWYETWEKKLVPLYPDEKPSEKSKDTMEDLSPAEIEFLKRELGGIELKKEKGDPSPIFQDSLVEQLKRLANGNLPPEPRLKSPQSRKPPPL